jgi:hypothetical protein
VPLAAAVIAAALVTIPASGAGGGLTGALWRDSVTFDAAITVAPDPGDQPTLAVIAPNPLCWTGSGNLALEFGLRVVPGTFTHLQVEVAGIAGKPSGQHYLRVGGTRQDVAGNGTHLFALDALTANSSGDYPVLLTLHQSVNKQAYLVIRLSNADGTSTSEQVEQVGPSRPGNCIDPSAAAGAPDVPGAVDADADADADAGADSSAAASAAAAVGGGSEQAVPAAGESGDPAPAPDAGVPASGEQDAPEPGAGAPEAGESVSEPDAPAAATSLPEPGPDEDDGL